MVQMNDLKFWFSQSFLLLIMYVTSDLLLAYGQTSNHLIFRSNPEGVNNTLKWNKDSSECLGKLARYPVDNQDMIKTLCETLFTYTKAILYHDHTFEAQVMYQHLYVLMNEKVPGPDETGESIVTTSLSKIFANGRFTFPQFEPLVHMTDQLRKLENSYIDVELGFWDRISMSLTGPLALIYGSKNPVSELVLSSWSYMESRFNFHIPTFTERRTNLMKDVAFIIRANKPVFEHDALTPENRIDKIISMIDEGLVYLTFMKQVEFLDALKDIRQVDWLILNLLSTIDQLNFGEVLKGAHVRLDDDGKLYRLISNHPLFPGKSRVSSHYPDEAFISAYASSSDVQRGMIPGTSLIFPELLMGVVVDKNGHRKSWFQLEAHGLSWKAPLESLGHFRDYVAHIRSGKLQVSKWGFSPHSEKKKDRANTLLAASEICYEKSSLEDLIALYNRSAQAGEID